MILCNKCIHEKACKAQYRYDTGASTDENFGYPDFQCENFEDKSYCLCPKYRIGDHVWTISVSDNDIPPCIKEFDIYDVHEIRWDGDEFEYYDSEYFLYGEHTLFSTKEEAEIALKSYLEV